MPDELRFTDPAFSCEVIIRGAHAALYRCAGAQFERLRKIRDLGLTGHFDDTGFHTKHHHLVGLMLLFEKLLVQPEGYGLPKAFLWSFWPRLCYGQTGHAAFSYDAEKAVLLACHVDAPFRRRFFEFLIPVVDEGANCTEGPNEEEKKARVSQWVDRLVGENQWDRVFHWVAALKLIQDQNLRGILENQHYERRASRPGFDWKKAILILIDPESEWDRAIRQLSRLDFVVRDLHLTGRIGITFDVDRLVANVNRPDDPDWLLVEQLVMYLRNTLYESIQRQTESAVFQRTLADLLVSTKVSLENLFGIDSENYFSDEDLLRLIRGRKQGRELLTPEVREAWRTWTIRGDLEKGQPPLSIERKLSGRRQGNSILCDPSNKRIMMHQLTQPNLIALSTRHRDSSDRPNPTDFILACKRCTEELYSFDTSDLNRALLESLFGCRVENGLPRLIHVLGGVSSTDKGPERTASKYIAKHSSRREFNRDPKIVITGIEQLLDQLGAILPLRIMLTTLSGEGNESRQWGVKIEDARQLLWSYLFEWQNRFFQKPPVQSLRGLILETQKSLRDRIHANEETKGPDLEAYVWLESLLHPNENVRFRCSLPNLILLKEDGQPENEYDVVSTVLRANNSVEVCIWGATTEENFRPKRTEDLRKIQVLKDKIGQRWSGEIRTPHGYVHVESGHLKLEYDGRQESR